MQALTECMRSWVLGWGGEGGCGQKQEGSRSLPQEGLGPWVTWGSYLSSHADNQYVCYVRIFKFPVFWTDLKKDIFMVIVAHSFYYIFM